MPFTSSYFNHPLIIFLLSGVIISLLVFHFGNSLMRTRRSKAAKVKSDEILEKSEERFERLVEVVKDYAIFMLDPKGYITTWNSGAERITGYTDEEAIGKHVSLFYTHEDIDNATAVKELTIAKEFGHFEDEGRRVRKDGSIYWASVVIAPLFNRNGILTGFSKVTRDITQFKESERRMRQLNEDLEQRVKARTRALEQRENQLRTVTNAVPILLAQLDLNETFLFANETFCKWFSREEKGVIGHTFREILGEDRYSQNEPFIQKALAGEVVNYERKSVSKTPQGDVTAVLYITFVPEFENKKVIGFIVVANDITNHKEIQEELKKAKEAAEVANATKSSFLANMSHEIRTPLGAVLGFSELLVNQNITDAEKANCVGIIKRNGLLLSNIINDILDLSKVEAGKMDIEKVSVSFNEVLKELDSILSLEAAEKGIELQVKCDDNVPANIKTDPLRLRQVLLNIVGNAIKFTLRGSVEVNVKLISTENARSLLAFTVKDTGEGIKPEQVERLFTPFMQADVSTTRKFGGTGLGLVLSKKLANALGGDVILTETTPGKGSIFTITIDPGGNENVQQSPVRLPPWTVSKKDLHARLEKLKVLIVDDSLDNQALIKKILELAGATVESANNGREAVNKASHGNYNVVLMDLQMPEMDGYEATRILRNQGYQKPIIALTAHAMKEERQRALQNGFDDHVTKPIDHQALVRTLSEYSL